MYQKHHLIIVLLVGIIIGLLGWNIALLFQPKDLHADSGAPANGFIMVTGLLSNNFEGCWVLDTSIPALCLYKPDNNGDTFYLSSARKIKYDVQLVELNDKTSKKRGRSYTVSRLKTKVNELNKKAEDKAK